MLNASRRLLVCPLLMTYLITGICSVCRAEDKLITGARVDLSYVTANAFAGAYARIGRVLTSPQAEMFPVEVFAAVGKKELGIDPNDVESVLVLVEPPMPVPGFGVVVRFSKPYRADEILPMLREGTEEGTIDGHAYRRARRPMGPSVYMPDDRTLIVAFEPTLHAMLEAKKKSEDSPLKQRLSQPGRDPDLRAVIVLKPVRELLNGLLMQVPIPPQFDDLKKVPGLLEAIEVDLKIMPDFYGGLTLVGRDEAAAIEIDKIVHESLEAGRQMILAQMDREGQSDDPVQAAMQKYMRRVSKQIVNAFHFARTKERLSLSGQGNALASVTSVSVLTALLLPAVQAAREAARRAEQQQSQADHARDVQLPRHQRPFPRTSEFRQVGETAFELASASLAVSRPGSTLPAIQAR